MQQKTAKMRTSTMFQRLNGSSKNAMAVQLAILNKIMQQSSAKLRISTVKNTNMAEQKNRMAEKKPLFN